MKRKDTIAWVSLILVLGVFAFVGITIYRVTTALFEAETRGHTYRLFFMVLEEHTSQTHTFPRSIDELLLVDAPYEFAEHPWPKDVDAFVNLIEPNFLVDPKLENLNLFAPDYATKADWGDTHCEFLWAQIVENCQPESP